MTELRTVYELFWVPNSRMTSKYILNKNFITKSKVGIQLLAVALRELYEFKTFD